MKKISLILIFVLAMGMLVSGFSGSEATQVLNSTENKVENVDKTDGEKSIIWEDYWKTRTAAQY